MPTRVEEVRPYPTVLNAPPYLVTLGIGYLFQGIIDIENPEFWESFLVGDTGTITFVEVGEGGHAFNYQLNKKQEPFGFYWDIPSSAIYFSGVVKITNISWDTQMGHYPIFVSE